MKRVESRRSGKTSMVTDWGQSPETGGRENKQYCNMAKPNALQALSTYSACVIRIQ